MNSELVCVGCLFSSCCFQGFLSSVISLFPAIRPCCFFVCSRVVCYGCSVCVPIFLALPNLFPFFCFCPFSNFPSSSSSSSSSSMHITDAWQTISKDSKLVEPEVSGEFLGCNHELSGKIMPRGETLGVIFACST